MQKELKNTYGSFPERIGRALLSHLKVDFQPEFSIGNSLKRFDLFVPSKSLVIEIHGFQH